VIYSRRELLASDVSFAARLLQLPPYCFPGVSRLALPGFRIRMGDKHGYTGR
jgi:hypothetical protein